MQKQKQIEIPEAATNIVQRLDFDAQGYKDIIIYLLSNKDIEISEERFNEYQEKYLEAKYTFELAKQEIEKQFIDSENITNYNWNLNYKNNILTITWEED